MTSAMFLILLDDPALCGVLRTLLESHGYRVIEAPTGERGSIESRSHRPDLIIADLGLPDMDGLTLIGRIRNVSPVPILVLSARTQESQRILALDAGADDYVTKPCSAPELLARVRASLRRVARGGNTLPVLRLGALSVDLTARQAQGPAGAVHLTPLEFRVLECLARRAGLIVTQQQLIREAWGPGRLGDTRGLRSYIKTLRQKLEPDPGRPRYLITEAGIGYRLCPDDATPPP